MTQQTYHSTPATPRTQLAIHLARIAHDAVEDGRMRHDVGLTLMQAIDESGVFMLGAEFVNAFAQAYAAFRGAFDTPHMRLKIDGEYADDARRRLRDLAEYAERTRVVTANDALQRLSTQIRVALAREVSGYAHEALLNSQTRDESLRAQAVVQKCQVQVESVLAQPSFCLTTGADDRREKPNGPPAVDPRYASQWDEIRYARDQPAKFAEIMDRMRAQIESDLRARSQPA